MTTGPKARKIQKPVPVLFIFACMEKLLARFGQNSDSSLRGFVLFPFVQLHNNNNLKQKQTSKQKKKKMLTLSTHAEKADKKIVQLLSTHRSAQRRLSAATESQAMIE